MLDVRLDTTFLSSNQSLCYFAEDALVVGKQKKKTGIAVWEHGCSRDDVFANNKQIAAL